MLQFSRWKTWTILGICLLGLWFAMPNLVSQSALKTWPGFLPKNQISLGLDLRGGAYILLEVGWKDVAAQRLKSLSDEMRDALFGRTADSDTNGREARIAYSGLRVEGDTISVRITDPAMVDTAVRRFRALSGRVGGALGGGRQELDIAKGEDQRITVSLSEPAVEEIRIRTVQQSIEIVRKRIDELGTRETSVQRQGEDRIIVQVPGADNPQEILDVIGKTAQMSFHEVDQRVTAAEAEAGRVPPGSVLLPYDENSNFAGGEVLVKERALISGEHLINAAQSFDPQTGQPVVTFRFDGVGSRRFADYTRKHVGDPFAIVLDGKVLTAPVIQSAILGGSGQISGNFTVESANQLAIMLRAGALPAPLQTLEQRTVGPELGADSIEAGSIAAVISLVAVVVFMLLVYGLFGLFANIALFLNLSMIAASLSLLGATLTLPGIAGVILTIGMAVDANVLIFERIREEVRSGKSVINAVEAGYQRALATILDANITTLIAAAILFQLGSGPVRGFAVTLAIGVITSVFTGFMVTRLMVAAWLRRRRPKVLPI